MMGTTAENIAELAREKVRLITESRERYLEAWVAETGLLPSECELVETMSSAPGSITVTVRVQKRGKP